MAKKVKNEEEILDEIDIDEDFEQEDKDGDFVEESDNDVPTKYTPEYQDWVLAQLTDDEVSGKNRAPKALGLLRMVNLLADGAPISLGEPDVHYATPEHAAVTCSISIGYRGNGTDCVYYGSAECSNLNTDEPYNKYPLATAQTRAIGRACKMALGINVLTAEESSKVADFTSIDSSGDREAGGITKTQINYINRLCKKLKIDVKNVVISIVGEYNTIDELTHKEALKVGGVLDGWTRAETDEDFKALGPYSETWKTDFKKGS